MSRILLIICLLTSVNFANAQVLKFSQHTWNFGTIAEDGGEVAHTFSFTNNTSSPVVIVNITTTCGCTTPKYSKQPIAAGKESTIEIIYDPLYRPGKFSREAKIYTSASDTPEVIKIVGNVTPRRRSVQESHPYLLGEGVRISSLYGFLQNVSPKTPRSTTFDIINTSPKDVLIDIKNEFPNPYLGASFQQTLAAGESGVVNVTYEIHADEPFYGELVDNLEVYIDGKKSNMTIQTRVYAVDDFVDASKKGGASALFSEKIINFEPFNVEKGSATKSFTIQNMGDEPLFIRDVKSPRGVDIGYIGRGEIAPNKSLSVDVKIPAGEAQLGDFVGYATFILNDAVQPVVRVRIVAKGEK